MQGRGDVSLLSESDIGSPFAFSTAIKANGPKYLPPTLASPDGGSSFYSQEPQFNASPSANGLPNMAERQNETAEASLAVTAASLSLNESSIGIIDLDAMQSDSSSGQLFLTSPQKMPHLHFSPAWQVSSAQQSPGSMQDSTGDPPVTASPPVPIGSDELARLPASEVLIQRSSGVIAPMDSLHNRAVGQEVSNASGYFSAQDSSGGQEMDAKLHTQHTPPPAIVIAPPSSNEVMGVALSMKPETVLDTQDVKNSLVEPQGPVDVPATFGGSVDGSPYLLHCEGLPPELLQGMSALSSSMFSGSESEGDTILSAMASALRVYKAAGGNPFSPDSSMDGVPSITSPDSYQSPQYKPFDENNKFDENPLPDESALPVSVHNPLSSGGDQSLGARQPSNAQEHPEMTGSMGESRVEKMNGQSLIRSPVRLSATSGMGIAAATETPPTSSSVPAGWLHDEDLGQGNDLLHEQRHLANAPVCGNARGNLEQSSISKAENSHSNTMAESIEGLPSTYLHPQDSMYPYDSTDATMSVLDSPFHPGFPPDSRQTPDIMMDSPGLFSSEALQKQSQGALYNPFDSDNEGVFLSEDFPEKEAGSFLEQLKKDEEELKLFNASHTTSTQGLSFDLRSFSVPSTEPSGVGSLSEEEQMSVSAYFQKHTYSLGAPFGGQQRPEHRPHFSDTLDHLIESPPAAAAGLDDTITATNVSEEDGDATPKHVKSMPTLDSTLVDDSGTSMGPFSSSDTAIDQQNTPQMNGTGKFVVKNATEHAQFAVPASEHAQFAVPASEHAEFAAPASEQTPVMTKYNLPKFSLGETYPFSPTLEKSPQEPLPAVTGSTAATPVRLTQSSTSTTEDHTSIVTSHPPVVSAGFVPASMLSNQAFSDATPKALTPLMSSTTRSPNVILSPLAPAALPLRSTASKLPGDLPVATVISKAECMPKKPEQGLLAPSQLDNDVRRTVPDGAGSENKDQSRGDPLGRSQQVKPISMSPDGAPVISMEEMKQKLLKLQQDLEEAKASANKLVANSRPTEKPFVTKVELTQGSSKTEATVQADLLAGRPVSSHSVTATKPLSPPTSDHHRTSFTPAGNSVTSSVECSSVASNLLLSKPHSVSLKDSLPAVSSALVSRSTPSIQHPPPLTSIQPLPPPASIQHPPPPASIQHLPPPASTQPHPPPTSIQPHPPPASIQPHPPPASTQHPPPPASIQHPPPPASIQHPPPPASIQHPPPPASIQHPPPPASTQPHPPPTRIQPHPPPASIQHSPPPASIQHPPLPVSMVSTSKNTSVRSSTVMSTTNSSFLVSTSSQPYSASKPSTQVHPTSVISTSSVASPLVLGDSHFQSTEQHDRSVVGGVPCSTISEMSRIPTAISEAGCHRVCAAGINFSTLVTRSASSLPSTSKAPPQMPIIHHSLPTSTSVLPHLCISHQQLPISPLVPPRSASGHPRQQPSSEAPQSGLGQRVVFSPPKHHDASVQRSDVSPQHFPGARGSVTVASTAIVAGSFAQSHSSFMSISSHVEDSATLTSSLTTKRASAMTSPATLDQFEPQIPRLSADMESLVMSRLEQLVKSRNSSSAVSVGTSTLSEDCPSASHADGRRLPSEGSAGDHSRLGEETVNVSGAAGGSWVTLMQQHPAEQALSSVSAIHQFMDSLGQSPSTITSQYMPTLPTLYAPGIKLAESSNVEQSFLPGVQTSRETGAAHSLELSSVSILQGGSADRPIYTSPLQPTLSTPSAASSDHLPAPPPPHSLQVAEVHQFSEVCCAGIPATDYIQVTNLGERWLQASVAVRSALLDGQLLTKPAVLFSFPQTIYIEHNETRLLKVTFSPILSGKYEAEVDIYASFMIGSDQSRDMPPTASFILQAEVEVPCLELRSQHINMDGSERVLDYGLMVVGSSMKYPIELINRGRVELPLELTIACDSPQILECFKFQSLPDSLDISTASSPQSHYLNAIKFALPGHASTGATPPCGHVLEISFTPPLQYSHSGVGSSLGQPEEVSARLEVSLRGSSLRSGPLQTVLLKATVGEAKLFIPKSLEAVTLSCTVGRAVTRVVPICNNGNVPVTAQLTVGGKDHTHFSLSTNSLLLEPNEESKLGVTFDPPTAPLIAEAVIQVHIEPGGPSFNVKLRGTAVSQPPPSEGVLSCNKRFLYWGGVALGGAKHLELQLHNSFTTPVPLKLSIRHPHTPFQVDREELILLPREEALIKINFFPFSTSVFVTALDIVDKAHSKKFRVPLCGYGGISRIEVGGIKFSPEGGHRLDIGDIQHSVNKKVKVLMYNSGPRAAFVHATCQELDGHTPISDNHAHISPSFLMIPAHSTGEISLYYRPTKAEEEMCIGTGTPLARLVLQSGDECVRHKLASTALGRAGSTGQPSVSDAISKFVKEVSSEDMADTDKTLIGFHLDDVESVFTSHLVLTSITLTCSPKMPAGQGKSSRRPAPKQELATPKLQQRHPLSPSYTPVDSGVSSTQVVPPPNLFTIQEEGPGIAAHRDAGILQNRHLKPKSQDSQKQRHVAKWLSQTKTHLPEMSDANRENRKISTEKKVVYLSKSFIQFPDTEVGSRAMFKVPVNNRDTMGHSVEVIKPSEPFSVKHRTFNLGSRMSARLPVYFTPTYSGVFEGILAIRSQSGHQAFAQLRGRATP